MRAVVFLCAAALCLSACKGADVESRAREAAEKIKESMPDVEAKALEQKVTPDQVKQAQEALTIANEYQGEVNGKLDAVTVNAIEAFQRSHGIRDNGLLTDETQHALHDMLAKPKAG